LDARVQTPPTETAIGDLFHQVVDDGKAFAAAEASLYKEIALYRVSKAKNGFIAFAVAAVLGLGGLIAFLVSLVMGLDPIVGPVAGGLIVLAGVGIIAFALVRYGAGKMAALSGDAMEKKALAAGERAL
jgi:hypothetical protein